MDTFTLYLAGVNTILNAGFSCRVSTANLELIREEGGTVSDLPSASYTERDNGIEVVRHDSVATTVVSVLNGGSYLGESEHIADVIKASSVSTNLKIGQMAELLALDCSFHILKPKEVLTIYDTICNLIDNVKILSTYRRNFQPPQKETLNKLIALKDDLQECAEWLTSMGVGSGVAESAILSKFTTIFGSGEYIVNNKVRKDTRIATRREVSRNAVGDVTDDSPYRLGLSI